MTRLLNCFTVLFLLTILFSGTVYSANEPFRSVTTGNWNSTATWEYTTNGGSTWITPPSAPNDASGTITIRSPHAVTVSVNTTANQLTIDSNAVLAINNSIILTITAGTGNDINMVSGSTLNGPGTIRTQGTIELGIPPGSAFNAPLNVNTGITFAQHGSGGRLFGNVTIDTAATLNGGNTSGQQLYIYGSVTNNGTLTATSTNGHVRIKGPSLINNGSIPIAGIFYLDTMTTISGSGSFTPAITLISGNVTMLSNITYSPTSYIATVTGGALNPNGNIFTLTSGSLGLEPGSTVSLPGTVRTQNTVSINLRAGSAFNAVLNVNTGITYAYDQTAPFDGSLFGNVTIDAGATLNGGNLSGRKLFIYGSVTNSGTLTTTSTNGTVRIKSPSLINNGSISGAGNLYFDTTTSVSGTGSFTSANQYISPNGKITLMSNITMSPSASLTMLPGGALLNLNGFLMTFNSGTFTLDAGNAVNGPGTVRTQGNVAIYTGNSSAFNADIKVIDGNLTSGTTAVDKIFGNVTIDNGASYNCGWSSGRRTDFYGNITNNGTLYASSTAGSIRIKGPSLINNGSVSSAGTLYFDTTTSVSGSGSFTSANQYISPNGKVTLMSNITMSPSANLIMLAGAAVLNLNGFVMTYNSGTFILDAGNAVNGPGTVMTQGNVAIYTGNSSAFNANIKVDDGFLTSGTTAVDRIFGSVTIDSGASYNCGLSSGRRTDFYGNVINNGTLTATSINGTIRIKGPSLTNNGVINHAGFFYFDTTTALSGSGTFTSHANFSGNANVTLNSSHQMRSITINSGSAFNISNQFLKLDGSGPIAQSGTFTTTGSKVEYNGTTAQNISVTNIIYGGLRINNSLGTFLLGNVTVNDTLSVINGDLDLNGGIITFPTSGYLTETPGNTVKGNTGYIVTTRSINAPSSLNVGGLGAILTSTANLGSTEIRRGHGVQITGSIKRYYDITPTNNSGLNATLKFKYDDSELNLRPEPTLKLKKSTNSGSTWTLMGGTVNTSLNEITIPAQSSFSRWTGDSSGVSAVIGMAIQGFYNSSSNRLITTDTVRIYLRNVVSPYAIVDSAKSLLDSSTLKAAYVLNAPSGTYYIQTKHRNSIETWSKSGGETHVSGNTLNYDFTASASNAFGNNMIQVDASPLRFAIYNGDENQDGSVDVTDMIDVYNDVNLGTSGYVVTDINGDDFVDVSDLVITYNNANNIVGVITP